MRVRRVASIVCYVAAGFFAYAVSLFAFVSSPDGRLIVMGIFGVLALISFVVGLAITRFQNWKRDAGIVLLSTAAMEGLTIVSIVSVWSSSVFREMVPTDPFAMFSDYAAGAGCFLAITAVGLLLVAGSKPAGAGASRS